MSMVSPTIHKQNKITQRTNNLIYLYLCTCSHPSCLCPPSSEIGTSLLRVARLTAWLAESDGSLLPGLWLTSPAGWLPRTGISCGTLPSAIEYGLPFFIYLSMMASCPGRRCRSWVRATCALPWQRWRWSCCSSCCSSVRMWRIWSGGVRRCVPGHDPPSSRWQFYADTTSTIAASAATGATFSPTHDASDISTPTYPRDDHLSTYSRHFPPSCPFSFISSHEDDDSCM